MRSSSDNLDSLLSHEAIIKRAEHKWNLKSSMDKIRCGRKYRHIFEKLNLPTTNWDNPFSSLSKRQMNILIKGELIRTYDSMLNIDKSHLKERFGLSSFSSKWFRLPSCDKKILLNTILRHEQKECVV